MKILFTSDWHLDRITAGFDRFDDVSKAVFETVSFACDNKIDLYIFLGDLANPNNVRSHRAASIAIRSAMLLSNHGIDSIWMVGNHDIIEDGTSDSDREPYSTLSVLKAAGSDVASVPKLFDKGRIAIIALPYPASNRIYDPNDAIAELAPKAVLADKALVVGHLSLSAAVLGSESTDMARGRGIEWPVDTIRSMLPDAVMIGGHYHRAQTISGVNFVGSLTRLGFDEEHNDIGFLVLEV